MGVVYINDVAVEVGDQERLNGIQAARRAGVEIPHYCWHAGLSVVASCRMCLVENGTRNAETGQVVMQPRVVPACQTPARDGAVFITNSDKVKKARAQVEEALLIDHPIDCPICDKAGECSLQDYHFAHGQKERRADIRPFTSRRREMGPTVTLFVDRCVMCTRCVRFTREISGTSELMVANRGSHEEIDVFEGFPLDNKLSGNVVDLCPVGALCDKDFLYKQRVWFMRGHDSVCGRCATGCSVRVEENQDHVYRIKPRENPHVNGWWICDEGRYHHDFIHDGARVIETRIRQDGDGDADGRQVDWSHVAAEVEKRVANSDNFVLALSPFITVEEAYLACDYVFSKNANAKAALGFVPVVGKDEVYPKGFTIRAEKCPNRRGVEEVIRHFAGDVVDWPSLANSGESSAAGGMSLWVLGGYPDAWCSSEDVEKLSGRLNWLMMSDLFDSPLLQAAQVQAPSVAYAERAGSFVNAKGRLQSFGWSVRPPAGVLSEGQFLWRLAGKTGLYNPRLVLDDAASRIPFFAAAQGRVGEHGVDLTAAAPALANA